MANDKNKRSFLFLKTLLWWYQMFHFKTEFILPKLFQSAFHSKSFYLFTWYWIGSKFQLWTDISASWYPAFKAQHGFSSLNIANTTGISGKPSNKLNNIITNQAAFCIEKNASFRLRYEFCLLLLTEDDHRFACSWLGYTYRVWHGKITQSHKNVRDFYAKSEMQTCKSKSYGHKINSSH